MSNNKHTRQNPHYYDYEGEEEESIQENIPTSLKQSAPIYYERQYASHRTGGAQERTSSSEDESALREQMRKKHKQMKHKS